MPLWKEDKLSRLTEKKQKRQGNEFTLNQFRAVPCVRHQKSLCASYATRSIILENRSGRDGMVIKQLFCLQTLLQNVLHVVVTVVTSNRQYEWRVMWETIKIAMKFITSFTDVADWCLSTSVIVELLADTGVCHCAVLVAAVVIGLVEAPRRVAAYNQHITIITYTSSKLPSRTIQPRLTLAYFNVTNTNVFNPLHCIALYENMLYNPARKPKLISLASFVRWSIHIESRSTSTVATCLPLTTKYNIGNVIVQIQLQKWLAIHRIRESTHGVHSMRFA